MSCTAKLPIYIFFAAAFFPEHTGAAVAIIYLLGITVGILLAVILKNTIFKGEAVPFVMELPNYRMPGWRNVGLLLWDKAKDFLERAFTVIFIASIVIWFLQYFDLHLNQVVDSHDSILAVLSGYAAPVLRPLGLGDWRIVTALISGFLAKESVVSTLGVLIGSAEAMKTLLTPLGAASLLTFCLLYTPCVAAVAAIKRELGWLWTVTVVVGQCAVAWICAYAVALIGVSCGFALQL